MSELEKVSDERLQEIVNGALPTFKEETKMAVELVTRRSQMSGLAQRAAEKIVELMNDYARGYDGHPLEEVAAIIEKEGR